MEEVGGSIDVPTDPGKSYARTTLPEPPNFPAPKAPDYDPAKPVATREAYGFALKRLGAANPHVMAISGDVKNSTFSEAFQDAYPDRFYQGYIAEQNLVSVGVGLAARGKVPFLDTFACFLARAYDQVRMAAISPEQHQPLWVPLRNLNWRGRTFTDGIGGYCDIPRGSFVGCVLPERRGVGRTPRGDDGAAAWN